MYVQYLLHLSRLKNYLNSSFPYGQLVLTFFARGNGMLVFTLLLCSGWQITCTCTLSPCLLDKWLGIVISPTRKFLGGQDGTFVSPDYLNVLWDKLILFVFHSVYFYVVAFIWFYPVLWESIADLLPLQSDQWRPWGPECWRYIREEFSLSILFPSPVMTMIWDTGKNMIILLILYIVCSLSTIHISTCSLVWCILLFKSQTFNAVSITPDRNLQTSVSRHLESSIGNSCIWKVLFTVCSLH